jgi:hypothetical protein
MAYTFSEELFSDLHKDAYGFRPRAHEFYDATPDRKQEIWDYVCHSLEVNMAAQEKAEAEALNEFRAEVRQVMDLVSCKWYDAVRHLMVAEGHEVGYNTYEQDFDYFLWDRGLGYTDRQKIYKLYKEAA